MSRLPLLLLGLLAAALSSVIALQLDSSGDAGDERLQAPPRRAAPAPAAAAPGRPDEWVATVLARPLFSPDRRPPPAAAEEAQAPDTALPRLTGTLVTTSGRSAIFAGDTAPLVVQEGGQVGAFTIRLIEPGQVTLMGPQGLRTVRPSFDANRPAAAPPQAPLPTTVLPASPPGAPQARLPRQSADPLNNGLPGGPSLGGDVPAEETVPFERNATPSGLDILRNSIRNAPPGSPGAAR